VFTARQPGRFFSSASHALINPTVSAIAKQAGIC